MADNLDELLAQTLAMQDYMDLDIITPTSSSTNYNNHNSSNQPNLDSHRLKTASTTTNPNPAPKILNKKCLPSILNHYISSKSIIDLSDDINSTNPDIHSLFLKYNYMYFDNKLSVCEVKWSKRMTLCAGLCCYEGAGGLCSIKLSSPLLKYRSTKEMIETLIHEMVHAFLFVTFNNRDRSSHGDRFKTMMNVINYVSTLNISIYHTFHDEVNQCRKHIWKCNGRCQHQSPYFGLVKRAMNRAPGPNDNWWSNHQRVCGGKYVKISEPKEFTEKQRKKKEREQRRKEREQMKKNANNDKMKGKKKGRKKEKVAGKKRKRKDDNVRTLVDMFGDKDNKEYKEPFNKKRKKDDRGCDSDIEVLDNTDNGCNLNTNNHNQRKVQCPICQTMFVESMINLHLDGCLM